MSPSPTIKNSPQARLLLYRLIASKLSDTEKRLLAANPGLWQRLLTELEAELDLFNNSDKAILTRAFSYIDKSSQEGLQRQVKLLTGSSLWLGIKATSLLEDFIKEHLTLIKSVQREHLEKIGLSLQRGIRHGLLQKDIAKEIRAHTSLGKHRANLIARSAPLQYSGVLTKYHQESAGIKRYRWQTSQDERVRKSHAKLDGQIFDWSDHGPHPRSEVNCRCDAVPVLDV